MDAGALRPAEGEELPVPAFTGRNTRLDTPSSIGPRSLGGNHKPGLPPVEVLAHAYVFSPSGARCAPRPELRHRAGVRERQDRVGGRWPAQRLEQHPAQGPVQEERLAHIEQLDSRILLFGTPKGEFAARNVAWTLETQAGSIWKPASVFDAGHRRRLPVRHLRGTARCAAWTRRAARCSGSAPTRLTMR